MNCDSSHSTGMNPISPVEAVAMKNAALRAVLGYLEYKNGPGEWFKDELTYRFHRMVELALEGPCDLKNHEPEPVVDHNQLSRQQRHQQRPPA
jgi:hypothetical protein